MKLAAAALVSALGWASGAFAESLQILDAGPQSMHMIDASSIEHRAQLSRAWLTTVWAGNQRDNIYYTRALFEFDCTEKKYHILSEIDYSKDESVLPRVPAMSNWDYIAPGTFGETAMQATCGPKAPTGTPVNTDLFTIGKLYRLGVERGDFK